MRGAVALVVVDPVLASLSRLHVGDAGPPGGMLAVDHLDERARDVGPVASVLRLVHMPAVGREPIVRRAVDDVEIGLSSMPKSFQSRRRRGCRGEAVSRVLGLVRGAGSVAALALEGEDTHAVRPGALQRKGSPAAAGEPCPEGPVLNLMKRVFPSISTWPGGLCCGGT